MPEIGNIEIPLRPLAKIVYLLFLHHPEGISFADMAQHQQELIGYYHEVSIYRNVSVLQEKVHRLIYPDPVSHDFSNLSTQVSRINKAFKDALGADIAAYYQILGPHGGTKKVKASKEFSRIAT